MTALILMRSRIGDYRYNGRYLKILPISMSDRSRRILCIFDDIAQQEEQAHSYVPTAVHTVRPLCLYRCICI